MRSSTALVLALGSMTGCTLLAEAALDDEDGATTAAGGAASSSSAGIATGSGANNAASGGATASSGPAGGAGPGPGGATSSGPGTGGGGATGVGGGGNGGDGGNLPCAITGCDPGYWCDLVTCLCQAPPTLVAIVCPAACTSCDLVAGLCIIALTGDHQMQTIPCPDGMACRFECGAQKGCEEALLECPDDQACEVVCSDTDSCRKAKIFGGDGGVTLQCLGAGSCKNANLSCGEGPCEHPCPSGSNGPLNVTCGGSCSCQACP